MNNRFRRWAALCGYSLAACVAVGAATSWAQQGGTAALSKLCEAAARDPDRGIPACTRLLAGARTGVNTASVYNNRGTGWSAKNQLDNALADFSEAIRRDPENVAAYANRGLLLMSRGETDRALSDFGLTISLNPNFAFGYMARATILSERGELDQAIADFDNATANDRALVPAYRGRAIAHYRKGNIDRAAADFDEVVRLEPKSPDGLSGRADVLIAQGRIDRAIADYSEAIQLQPSNASLFSSRGEAHRIKGDLRKALADHDEAIRLNPQSVEAYNDRGLTWLSRGAVDRAVADFDTAISMNPSYGYAYLNRGEAFRAKGDFSRSLADFEKAMSLLGKSSLQLCRRGDTFRHAGRLELASNDYEEALRLSPTAICALIGKGLLAEAKGEAAVATAEFQRAASIPAERDPEPIAARETQAIAHARLALRGNPPAKPAARTIAARDEASVTTSGSAGGGKRVGLVIGNAAYLNLEVLPNSRRDAASVAQALRRLGFESVVQKTDVTREELAGALRDFAQLAANADWAVIYFVGHGLQVGGANYLLPVDAALVKPVDMRADAVMLDEVVASVRSARKLRLVMVDASREALFPTTNAPPIKNAGLAAIAPDDATLVVYAARAGQLAVEGSGSANSPFVSALLRNLEKPRVDIRKLFELVRDDVIQATNNRQQPFTYGSVPGREDFFIRTSSR